MRSSKIHLVIYLLWCRHGRGRHILEHSKLLHWSAQICSEKPFPNYSLTGPPWLGLESSVCPLNILACSPSEVRARSCLVSSEWHCYQSLLNTFATEYFPMDEDGRPLLRLAEDCHFTDFYQTFAAHPSQASSLWPLTHSRLSSHHIALQLFREKPNSNGSCNSQDALLTVILKVSQLGD